VRHSACDCVAIGQTIVACRSTGAAGQFDATCGGFADLVAPARIVAGSVQLAGEVVLETVYSTQVAIS
jgi:hypothetical protein